MDSHSPFTIPISTQIYITPQLQKILDQYNIAQYGPAYGGESAGLDLYNAGPDITIDSSKPFLISTGLHVVIPPGHVGLILDRGSVIKTDLIRLAGVVDCGYLGEVFVATRYISTSLLNRLWAWICNFANYFPHPNSTVEQNYQIAHAQKLPFQLIVVPVVNQFQPISKETLEAHALNSQRKDGKIGSSNP